MPLAPSLRPTHSPISHSPAAAAPARARRPQPPPRTSAHAAWRAPRRPTHQRPVGEVDQVIDAGAAVDPDRVATGIDEQGQRHREIELARVRRAAPEQPPRDRDREHPTGVADRPQAHALAVIAGLIRVQEGIDREGDDRGLGRADRGDPGDITRGWRGDRGRRGDGCRPGRCRRGWLDRIHCA